MPWPVIKRSPIRWAVVGALACAVPAGSPAQTELPSIRGVVTVTPDLAAQVGPDDRLIIKLYHPEGDVELDAKYQIVERFVLPFPFLAAPSIDMNARTKYDAYVVEVLTDKDGDPAAVAPGELIARSRGPVPLGTRNLRLQLDTLRE
jgi:hypothetical protein